MNCDVCGAPAIGVAAAGGCGPVSLAYVGCAGAKCTEDVREDFRETIRISCEVAKKTEEDFWHAVAEVSDEIDAAMAGAPP